ncbi:MAG: hypothetical protein OEM91_18010 [Hyphomicrobiales bacterium]|nr:hypothetical protein [Hyphomicrobiales bacterium]
MTAKKASKRTSRQKDAQDGAPARKYEPTPREQAALDALASRRKEHAPAPIMKVDDNNPGQMTFDHDEIMVGFGLLKNVVGTTDTEFLCGLLSQISNAVRGQRND